VIVEDANHVDMEEKFGTDILQQISSFLANLSSYSSTGNRSTIAPSKASEKQLQTWLKETVQPHLLQQQQSNATVATNTAGTSTIDTQIDQYLDKLLGLCFVSLL
jgi:hypothetical protein